MINNQKWSEEKKFKFKKSYVKGKIKNIDVEILSIEEIENLFHELKVKSVNESQPQRIKTINDKGKGEWSKITKKGALNRKIRFLKEYDILSSEIKYTDEEINKLFLLYFNKLSKHGDKISRGRHDKHKTNEKYKLSYSNAYKQAFLNYCTNNNLKLTPENYDELYKIFCKRIQHDIPLWKKSHLDNRKIEYTEENFNEKYSEYIRERFKMVDSMKSGYKRTKKGWFNTIDKKIFYRSSWELKVLKYLQELYNEHVVESIDVPERILYYMDGYKHYYYPDIEFKLYDHETKILEIKPVFKIDENILKLEAATQKHSKNFIILSEEDIFDDDLKNKLIEYGKL